jgi:Aspartyl protease
MVAILGLVLSAGLVAAPEAVLPLHPYLAQQEALNVTLEGVSGSFLFDTGEGVTAITTDFAERIGCRPWGKITGFRMSGERLGLPHCDDLSFAVGGVTLPVPSAITLNITDLIGFSAPHVDGAIGLDAFAGRVITIVPRSCIVLESPSSLAARVAFAKALPIRLVRDAEGIALSVDGAVPTSDGLAWMELDSGNGGTFVVANYIGPLLGLSQDASVPVSASFKLANGITVAGPTRTRDLILDGDIGARFLNDWDLTLDLGKSKAWLSPKTTC